MGFKVGGGRVGVDEEQWHAPSHSYPQPNLKVGLDKQLNERAVEQQKDNVRKDRERTRERQKEGDEGQRKNED